MEKATEKTTMLSRISAKGDISQCVNTLTKVAKSLFETRKEVTPAAALDKHMKTAIDILNQKEAVDVASPF